MTKFEGDDLAEYEDVWDEYTGYVISAYDSRTSADRRSEGVKSWLLWCEETQRDPYDSHDDDVRNYVDSQLELADTTISSHFDSVTLFYEWLTRKEYPVDSNPTTGITLEDEWDLNRSASEYIKALDDEGKDHLIALDADRARKIFGEARDPSFRNELILQLLWDTAIRSVELAGALLREVDTDKRTMWVDSAKLNRHDHPDLYRRQVSFTPETARMLEMWLDRVRADHSPYAGSSKYLLLTDQSEKMRPSHISRIVKEAAHDAGIQEPMYIDGNGHTRWLVTAHRLRHSRLTDLANGEHRMSIPALRKFAGHARLETTLSYVHTDWGEVLNQYQSATQPK